MRSSEIEALLERVRGLKGPDREIDERMFAAFWGWSYPIHGAARQQFDELGADVVWVTASLDAIFGLIERELSDGEPLAEYPVEMAVSSVGPGYPNHQKGPWRAAIWTGNECDRNYHQGQSPALALCICFLAAKLAMIKETEDAAIPQ